MGLLKVEGLVIRTRPLGEADRAVTIYTRDSGKVRGIARGSRRPRSRLSGATQPFTHGRFLIFEGGSLDTISQAQAINSFPNIKGDLVRMAYASVAAELVDRACEEGEPSPALFDLLMSAVTEIEQADEPNTMELSLLAFELGLTGILGYGPELRACVRCRRILNPAAEEGEAPAGAPVPATAPVPAGAPVFDVAEGGLVCGACRSGVGERGHGPGQRHALNWGAVMVMRRLAASGPREGRTLRVAEGTRRAIERVLRDFLDYRLEGHARSADFLDLVRRQ